MGFIHDKDGNLYHTGNLNMKPAPQPSKLDEIIYQHCGDCQKSKPCKFCVEAKSEIKALMLKVGLPCISDATDGQEFIDAVEAL